MMNYVCKFIVYVYIEIFRIFMEFEVKNLVLRKDLYEKMVKLCFGVFIFEERE